MDSEGFFAYLQAGHSGLLWGTLSDQNLLVFTNNDVQEQLNKLLPCYSLEQTL